MKLVIAGVIFTLFGGWLAIQAPSNPGGPIITAVGLCCFLLLWAGK